MNFNVQFSFRPIITLQAKREFFIMKTFQSLMVSITTLFVVLSSFAQSTNFMHNGKPYDDKFHELFTNEAPVEEIIKSTLNWNADKQLDHFGQLYQHITSNDKWARYAQDIIDAGRAVLQRSLHEVGFKKEMTLEQYLVGMALIQNDKKQDVAPDVLEGIELLEKVDGDTLERLLNQGSEAELEWELNNLHPYDMAPKVKKMFGIVEGPAEPKSEKSQDERVQQSQKSEASPVSESQKSEDELVSEPQESGESVAGASKLENDIPKPKEFEEVPQKVEETTKGSVNEPKDSVENVIAQTGESKEKVPSL